MDFRDINFYIFRHGATIESLHHIGYTETSVLTSKLAPEGIPAIKKLSEYLKNVSTDVNFTSPLPRCLETSEIVSTITGKKFAIDERLKEYTHQLGESFEKMAKRNKEFLKYLNGKNFKSVAICTHGGCISALKYYIQNKDYSLNDLYDFPAPGVLWEIKRGIVTAKVFNIEG